MLESPAEACIVCGENCPNRCGSCANFGEDLYFCSKEHQKLIWYAHKKVCGRNSRPFVLPPLTAEEAEAARASAGEKTMVVVHDMTLPEAFKQMFGVKPADFSEYIDSLCKPLNGRPDDASARLAAACGIVRSRLFLLNSDKPGTVSNHGGGECKICTDPLWATAKVIDVEATSFLRHGDGYSDPYWHAYKPYNHFHHLILAYNSLTHRLITATSAVEDFQKLTKIRGGFYARLFAEVERVARADEVAAKRIGEGLLAFPGAGVCGPNVVLQQRLAAFVYEGREL